MSTAAEERHITARLRDKGQLTLPAEIREALRIDQGDEVEFEVIAPGVVQLIGTIRVPADQAWFWTEQWQAGEREASAELRAGEGTVYKDGDELLKALGE